MRPGAMKPHMIEKMIEWREQGRSFAWIAKQLGVSRSAINWQCLKYGVEPPKRNWPLPAPCHMPVVKRGNHVVRRFTPDEDRKLIEWREQGMRVCDIGKRLGRKGNSITGRLYTLARHENVKEEALWK